MTAGSRRILHIGQRKTGSTWLQFGGQRAAEAGLLSAEHARLLAWSRSVNWKSATATDYEAFAALLPDRSDRPALASCETLIVHDPRRMAEALRRRWPDAHVLVTTRAPQDYLMSSFRNDSTTGFEDAAAYARRFTRGHMSRSHDLDGVASGYGEALGADRVHFLPYELLRDDRAAFVARLESLLGVSIHAHLPDERMNASPPAAFLLMARRINALVGAEAPHLLETKDWISFMRFASVAASSAQGMDEFYATFARESPKASDALPRIDREAELRLAGRMRAISGLADYAPYLRRYGLAGAEAA